VFVGRNPEVLKCFWDGIPRYSIFVGRNPGVLNMFVGRNHGILNVFRTESRDTQCSYTESRVPRFSMFVDGILIYSMSVGRNPEIQNVCRRNPGIYNAYSPSNAYSRNPRILNVCRQNTEILNVCRTKSLDIQCL
jgi:hypothetical protein